MLRILGRPRDERTLTRWSWFVAFAVGQSIALILFWLIWSSSASDDVSRTVRPSWHQLLPFVAFGILHSLRVAMAEGAGGSPVEMAYRSRPLQLCVLGWMIATAWSLGLSLPI